MGFDIFPWGPMKRKSGERDVAQALSDMRACGFTGSCFVEPQYVPLCREAGLTPNVFLFDDTGLCPPTEAKRAAGEFYLSSTGLPNVCRLAADKAATPQIIDRVMKNALDRVPEGPARVFICDEPGAAWLPRVREMADCVRRYRSDLTPYVNLFPNYAVCGAPDLSQLETDSYEEYLDRFCREAPGLPVSIDNYMVFVSKEFRDEGLEAQFYLNYVQAREACDRYGVDFWHVICSNQLRSFQPIPTFANLLLQASTSLAAGARSVSWYTYFGRGGYLYAPVDDNTERDVRTGTWYLLREVNRRLLSWGGELGKMRYEGMYFTHPEGIPRARSIKECAPVTRFESDEPCVIGLYRDGEESVFFAVNGSLIRSTRLDVEIGGRAPRIWSAEENDWIRPLLTDTNGNTSPLWLAPGDAAMLRI